MLEEKYQTVVLTVRKNRASGGASVADASGASGGDPPAEYEPPYRAEDLLARRRSAAPTPRTLTRTVTLEQVTQTLAVVPPADGRLRVGVLLRPGGSLLDVAGPADVFHRTGRVWRRPGSAPGAPSAPFQVVLVAETTAPVACGGGLELVPHVDLDACPELDIFLVPGGAAEDAGELRHTPAVVDFVRRQGKDCKLLAGVGSGVLLLARAGLLGDRRVATDLRSLPELEAAYGDIVRVQRHLQWVQHGKVFTGAEGTDVALRIVRQILGETVARGAARELDCAFPESDLRRYIDVDDGMGDDEFGSSRCESKCTIM